MKCELKGDGVYYATSRTNAMIVLRLRGFFRLRAPVQQASRETTSQWDILPRCVARLQHNPTLTLPLTKGRVGEGSSPLTLTTKGCTVFADRCNPPDRTNEALLHPARRQDREKHPQGRSVNVPARKQLLTSRTSSCTTACTSLRSYGRCTYRKEPARRCCRGHPRSLVPYHGSPDRRTASALPGQGGCRW